MQTFDDDDFTKLLAEEVMLPNPPDIDFFNAII
jgi:hypothetical protein